MCVMLGKHVLVYFRVLLQKFLHKVIRALISHTNENERTNDKGVVDGKKITLSHFQHNEFPFLRDKKKKYSQKVKQFIEGVFSFLLIYNGKSK